MRMLRRICLVLALTLLLGTLPARAAEATLLPLEPEVPAFADLAGSRFAPCAQTVCRAGLMQGKAAGRFDASSSLTWAQCMAVSARLHNRLQGGTGDIPLLQDAAWYLAYYNYMAPLLNYSSGTEMEDSGFQPDAPCTRIGFAALISTVLRSAGIRLPAVNETAGIPDLDPMEAGSSYDDVLELYRAGVLTGFDAYGSFRAFETLNRGQAAAILARLVDPAQRSTQTPASFDLIRDLLHADPDAIVYTVNGSAVTLRTFASLLAEHFFTGSDPAESASYAEAALRRCAGIDALAQAHGVTLSADAQAEAEAAAARCAGFAGLTQEAWLVRRQQMALEAAVRSWYVDTYGAPLSPLFQTDSPDGVSRMLDDLSAAEAAAALTSTGYLEGLDWASITRDAAATPYARYFFQKAV